MNPQVIVATRFDPCPHCGGFDSAHWVDSGPGWDTWRCRGECGSWTVEIEEPKENV